MNPFTGGVPWGVHWATDKNLDVVALEWRHVGLSEVYPACHGQPEWGEIDAFVKMVVKRGHQAILRPVVVGPGYGDGRGNFAPSDLKTSGLWHDSKRYKNPRWDEESVQACVLNFIDAFAAHYNDDPGIAYIQMGLVGLWGEHHIGNSRYTAKSFPSAAFQKEIIEHYLEGFGESSSDLLCSVSIDSAQGKGLFAPRDDGSLDGSLDHRRIGFFDDTLLADGHSSGWRANPAPAKQLALHMKHGWGGEAGFRGGCNNDRLWTVPPSYDCGNGESLGDQAARLGLNYMLGDNAFDGTVSPADLLKPVRMMGYKFTATGVRRESDGAVAVTVQNTGVAYCPYKVEVCTGPHVCAGDLSTLAPGSSTIVTIPASGSTEQVLSLTSPRLNADSPRNIECRQKIRWSNLGASASGATLTVTVDEG